jgi:outer membrane protein
MMKNIGKTAVLLLVALAATPAMAELKLAFINTQRVMSESPQAKKASKKIEDEFLRREQELQQMSKSLKALQDGQEKNALTMSEGDRRAKEREISDLNRDLQRKQREFREDLNLRKNEEMASILERANKVIKQIAEAEKFDLIVQEAVYFSPRIDITDKVIKALGDAAQAK